MNLQTRTLREAGYWASYNRPAYEEHQEKVGGNEKAAEFGDWFTHGETARAKIFRRDQGKVGKKVAHVAYSNDVCFEGEGDCPKGDVFREFA